MPPRQPPCCVIFSVSDGCSAFVPLLVFLVCRPALSPINSFLFVSPFRRFRRFPFLLVLLVGRFTAVSCPSRASYIAAGLALPWHASDFYLAVCCRAIFDSSRGLPYARPLRHIPCRSVPSCGTMSSRTLPCRDTRCRAEVVRSGGNPNPNPIPNHKPHRKPRIVRCQIVSCRAVPYRN